MDFLFVYVKNMFDYDIICQYVTITLKKSDIALKQTKSPYYISLQLNYIHSI